MVVDRQDTVAAASMVVAAAAVAVAAGIELAAAYLVDRQPAEIVVTYQYPNKLSCFI